jgi:hypothetical protein
MQPPTLPAAVEHLAGGPLVLRASPRHGCGVDPHGAAGAVQP